MTHATSLIQLHFEPETVVVNVLRDLREFEFAQIEEQARRIIELLDVRTFRNLVIDFSRTDVFGSTALSCFSQLSNEVSQRNGQMVFCGLSPHEREMLQITRLDTLWPMVGTKKEALRAIRNGSELATAT
jgi:anti-anti-sigma factor